MAIEEEKDHANEEVEKKAGSSTLKIVIVSVVLALVIGGGLVGATFYFVSNMNADQASPAKNSAEAAAEEEGGEDEDEAERKAVLPPKYHSMDPQFVVSFSNQQSARFMQFSLDIMTRDAEVIKQVEAHMPVIRSSLLMLFGSQTYEDMVTSEGKQRLLNTATEDINATLLKISGEDELESSVEAAYFSSFVIQ